MIPNSPSVQLYTLGRGALYIADYGAQLTYAAMGNCPKFDVEVVETLLDHFSSQSGLKMKDAETVLETGYNLTFDCDEFSVANLTRFLAGTLSGNTILAATALSKEFAIKFEADNPIGPSETWEFWRARLTPGGALALIGDSWMQMAFKGAGLADVAFHPTSPWFNVTFQTTTTTTTTTTTS
jgi:hypothetical protein